MAASISILLFLRLQNTIATPVLTKSSTPSNGPRILPTKGPFDCLGAGRAEGVWENIRGQLDAGKVIEGRLEDVALYLHH